ncbi:MAG: hypothetical protein ABH956_02015 [Candidatus Nealsonbacteria bacterium]
MKKEIEVKIELTKEEFDKFTKNLNNSNLERTFGYFKEDFSNITDGIFPRIKQIVGEQVILGIKKKTKENIYFFERDEIEIEIKGNIDTLREMVKLLGFSKEIIFEKIRRNIFNSDSLISFDKLPFGFFVEIEGNPKVINHYLKKFNLLDKPKIVKSYLGIWEDYKKFHNIKKDNCIFD